LKNIYWHLQNDNLERIDCDHETRFKERWKKRKDENIRPEHLEGPHLGDVLTDEDSSQEMEDNMDEIHLGREERKEERTEKKGWKEQKS
jgi:hypothetical protein